MIITRRSKIKIWLTRKLSNESWNEIITVMLIALEISFTKPGYSLHLIAVSLSILTQHVSTSPLWDYLLATVPSGWTVRISMVMVVPVFICLDSVHRIYGYVFWVPPSHNQQHHRPVLTLEQDFHLPSSCLWGSGSI